MASGTPNGVLPPYFLLGNTRLDIITDIEKQSLYESKPTIHGSKNFNTELEHHN